MLEHFIIILMNKYKINKYNANSEKKRTAVLRLLLTSVSMRITEVGRLGLHKGS